MIRTNHRPTQLLQAVLKIKHPQDLPQIQLPQRQTAAQAANHSPRFHASSGSTHRESPHSVRHFCRSSRISSAPGKSAYRENNAAIVVNCCGPVRPHDPTQHRSDRDRWRRADGFVACRRSSTDHARLEGSSGS